MRRKISRITFQDGLAVGWTFGMPPAFKEALGIAFTERALSGRRGLLAELSKEGFDVPADLSELKHNEIFDILRRAGLTLKNIVTKPSASGPDRLFAEIETESDPPQYNFSTGDIFYEPPEVRLMPWGDGTKILKRCVQITDVDGDQVTATLWNYEAGTRSEPVSFSCSQMDLADFLRTGSNKTIQAADAKLAISLTSAIKSDS